jgi:hypothetical protein
MRGMDLDSKLKSGPVRRAERAWRKATRAERREIVAQMFAECSNADEDALAQVFWHLGLDAASEVEG